ncbi:Pentapeptide repeat-containing protein [Hyphomicrobium sp. 1Nfss2.1]
MPAIEHPGLSRRAFNLLLAASLPTPMAFSRSAPKLSARAVVETLFKASAEEPPKFSHADLSDLDLADLDFKRADLSSCNLFGTDLSRSNLEGSNLSRTKLDRSTLTRARLSHANLEGASIRRPSIYSDMSLNPADVPTLRFVNLCGATVTARLDDADFTGANLSRARFVVWAERHNGGPPTTGLARCDFSSARMMGVDVRGVSLTGAIFRQADLTAADLRSADLSYADFEGAVLTGARFEGARLEGAKGLG